MDAESRPYHFAAGEAGVFDSAEYRAVFYALKLLANPRDIAIGRSLSAITRSFRADKDTPQASNTTVAPASQLLPQIAAALGQSVLAVAFDALASATSGATIDQTITSLMSWVPPMSETTEAVTEIILADREFLKHRWTTYMSTVDAPERSWAGFLMELTRTPRPESPGYRVLTVHAAKGLEFKAVGILGMNDGSFPDFRNVDLEGLEGEQRLLYVAATRAARVLRLSRPRLRATRFGPRVQDESRFLQRTGLAADEFPAE